MKTASILLALVVVLGFVREAGAALYHYDYTISIAGTKIGFVETGSSFGRSTYFRIGSKSVYVPFTAKQCHVGCCVILAMLVIVPVVLSVRWRRKRAAG